MGAAKEEMMRYQSERWTEIDKKYLVCENCFDDAGIKEYIVKNSDDKGCAFCKKASLKGSIDLNSVIGYIADCINREFGEPAGFLPWDSEDGRYLLESKIYSTEDLIRDLVESRHDDLLDLIISAFDESARWVHANVLRDEPGKILSSLWQRFSETVMFERRFFFPRANKNRAKNISYDELHNTSDILTAISKVSKDVDLFRIVKKGVPIYRARKFGTSEDMKPTLGNFGVPDRSVSKKFSNRMSPAGIPIFYGSESSEIARKEVSYAIGDIVRIAKFCTNKDLFVLDLTLIPDPPSIFSISSWELREKINFLCRFRNEIMKKVDREGHEHVDYIPSQIFTEFFRYRVKVGKRKIDGIVFPSTYDPTAKNFAIFCDNERIVDTNQRNSADLLKFKSVLKK